MRLPEGHKYHGKPYGEIPVDCHGGLTYSHDRINALAGNADGWWIGWDYAHFGDYNELLEPISEWKKWTTAEIFEEMKEVIEQLEGGEARHEKVLSAECADGPVAG